MLIIRNARLIPELTGDLSVMMTDKGLMADLVIENGRFKEIAPAGSIEADGAEEMDLGGRTALPGMFDLHMHLYFSSANFAAVAQKTQNDYVFDSIRYANEMLRQGFTTIRDAGNPYYIGITLRDAINAGVITGPRIYTSGIILTPTAKGNDTFPNLYRELDDPSDLRQAVRAECAKGVDWVKYMATGSVANLTGVPGELITSIEELNALQAEADSRGVPTMVHCHGIDGIRLCAEAGINTIEHASMIDEEAIELILRNQGRTSIVPTLDPVVQMHRGDDCEDMPQIIMDKIDEVYSHTGDLVKATRAGILTGWGTDVSMSFFHNNPGYEFDVRSEVGYTNLEILEQATINSARILGVDDRLGTIEKGKLADLVVIDGNPDEDISVMTKLPDLVLREGRRMF